MDEESSYLNQRQAADYIKLSESTLEKLRLTGRGPRYSKPLRRVLYRKADLDAFVAAHLRQSTSDLVSATA